MLAAASRDARVFVLDTGKHVRLVGRLLSRLALFGLLALVAVQLSLWSDMGAEFPQAGLVCVLTLLLLVAGLGGIGWLSTWAAASRYRLLLGQSWVATDSAGKVDEAVHREELSHVCESPLGLVLVKKRGVRFRIPSSLDGYDEVRQQLATWFPLTKPGSPHFRPWLGPIAKLAIVLLTLLVVSVSAILLAVLNGFVQMALRLLLG